MNTQIIYFQFQDFYEPLMTLQSIYFKLFVKTMRGSCVFCCSSCTNFNPTSNLKVKTEVYLKPSRAFVMELFVKIVNNIQPISQEISIIDVRLGCNTPLERSKYSRWSLDWANHRHCYIEQCLLFLSSRRRRTSNRCGLFILSINDNLRIVSYKTLLHFTIFTVLTDVFKKTATGGVL